MKKTKFTRRINSMGTLLMGEKLCTLSGFPQSYSIDEWPIYESNDYPQRKLRKLRQMQVPMESADTDPDDDDPFDNNRNDDQLVVCVCDVLGEYWSDHEQIVMYPRVIADCAHALRLPYQVLYEVVLAHEISHAITHVSISSHSYAWRNFDLASTQSVEYLAQLLPFLCFYTLGMEEHLAAMETLSHHQSAQYNTYKNHPLRSQKGVKAQKELAQHIIDIREREYQRVKTLSHFEVEWRLFLKVEGQNHYVIKNTGLVWSADEGSDPWCATKRYALPCRVSPSILRDLKRAIDNLTALGLTQGEFAPRGTVGPTTEINIQENAEPFSCYRTRSNKWGTHQKVFDDVLHLAQKAIAGAK